MKVTVIAETDTGGNDWIKICRDAERGSTTAWFTRAEAQSLYHQLGKLLFKGG